MAKDDRHRPAGGHFHPGAVRQAYRIGADRGTALGCRQCRRPFPRPREKGDRRRQPSPQVQPAQERRPDGPHVAARGEDAAINGRRRVRADQFTTEQLSDTPLPYSFIPRSGTLRRIGSRKNIVARLKLWGDSRGFVTSAGTRAGRAIPGSRPVPSDDDAPGRCYQPRVTIRPRFFCGTTPSPDAGSSASRKFSLVQLTRVLLPIRQRRGRIRRLAGTGDGLGLVDPLTSWESGRPGIAGAGAIEAVDQPEDLRPPSPRLGAADPASCSTLKLPRRHPARKPRAGFVVSRLGRRPRDHWGS
jgi:hypothetical protein